MCVVLDGNIRYCPASRLLGSAYVYIDRRWVTACLKACMIDSMPHSYSPTLDAARVSCKWIWLYSDIEEILSATGLISRMSKTWHSPMAISCEVRELCRMLLFSTAGWRHEHLALQAGVVLVYVAKKRSFMREGVALVAQADNRSIVWST